MLPPALPPALPPLLPPPLEPGEDGAAAALPGAGVAGAAGALPGAAAVAGAAGALGAVAGGAGGVVALFAGMPLPGPVFFCISLPATAGTLILCGALADSCALFAACPFAACGVLAAACCDGFTLLVVVRVIGVALIGTPAGTIGKRGLLPTSAGG